MDHGDVDGEGHPFVQFEQKFSCPALSDCVAVGADRVFSFDDDASGGGVVVVVFNEVFDPVVHVCAEVFFVGGDVNEVFVFFIRKFFGRKELFVTCSKV